MPSTKRSRQDDVADQTKDLTSSSLRSPHAPTTPRLTDRFMRLVLDRLKRRQLYIDSHPEKNGKHRNDNIVPAPFGFEFIASESQNKRITLHATHFCYSSPTRYSCISFKPHHLRGNIGKTLPNDGSNHTSACRNGSCCRGIIRALVIVSVFQDAVKQGGHSGGLGDYLRLARDGMTPIRGR